MKKQRVLKSSVVSHLEKKRKAQPGKFLKTSVFSLSKNHPSIVCFGAYSRVENFIKHQNNLFSLSLRSSDKYDSAFNKMQDFRDRFPTAKSSFKASFYPKVPLSSDLTSQIHLLNAFYNMSNTLQGHNRRPKTALRKHRRKHSDKLILGCHYSGFVSKMDIESDRINKNPENLTQTSIDKSLRKTVFKRQRNSTQPVFISEIESPKNLFTLRKSLRASNKFYRNVKEKPFEDLISVSPIAINPRPKTSTS